VVHMHADVSTLQSIAALPALLHVRCAAQLLSHQVGRGLPSCHVTITAGVRLQSHSCMPCCRPSPLEQQVPPGLWVELQQQQQQQQQQNMLSEAVGPIIPSLPSLLLLTSISVSSGVFLK